MQWLRKMDGILFCGQLVTEMKTLSDFSSSMMHTDHTWLLKRKKRVLVMAKTKKRTIPSKKADDPAKTGKYTPMHWASYHGHYKVVWILMKANMSPLIKDMHGNNAVH
jgi:hypothetical protein